MQVKSSRMLLGILQYFRPALSYHLSLRPSFYLFLSGRLRQVWLYTEYMFRSHKTNETQTILTLEKPPDQGLQFVCYSDYMLFEVISPL